MGVCILLLDEYVKVKLKRDNRDYYKNKNYKINESEKEINVKTIDLPPYSKIKINVSCDYCGEVCQKTYADYLAGRKHIPKDSCRKCFTLKNKEIHQIKYGTDYFKTQEYKNKMRKTCLEKYGVEHHLYSQKVREKIKKTFVNKYGVDNYAKTEEYKEKFKQTSLERYGETHPWKNSAVFNKGKNTLKEKYGVENPMHHPKIKERLYQTLYENGTAPCSKQQIYISNLLKGELNYPVGSNMLDIAFPNEKIYIEYDGSGHGLSVKFGSETQEEFDKRNMRRSYYLKRRGWKEIRLISSKDILPSDDKILEMVQFARRQFETGRTWVTFNIDDGTVNSQDLNDYYNYGDLKQVS